MGIIGRPLAELAANIEQIDDLLIYSGTIGMTGLATVLFPLFSNFYVGQIVYAIFLGLYFGCCYVVTGSVFIKLVGVEFMAKAIGFQFFCGSIGSVMGPVIAGNVLFFSFAHLLSKYISYVKCPVKYKHTKNYRIKCNKSQSL